MSVYIVLNGGFILSKLVDMAIPFHNLLKTNEIENTCL